MNDFLLNIKVVLVEPQSAGNIGSVARSMKNMGLTKLTMVNPFNFPDKQANLMAVHAKDILENAVIVNSIQEALEDIHFAVATTARNRSIPWPQIKLTDFAKLAVYKAKSNQKIAVLFGREDIGLTNDYIEHCEACITINSHPDYPSLNLSHAVQIISYQIYQQAFKSIDNNKNKQKCFSYFMYRDKKLAKHSTKIVLLKKFLELMAEIGFYNEHSKLMVLRFKRMIVRMDLDFMEANIILGFIKNIKRKLINKDG